MSDVRINYVGDAGSLQSAAQKAARANAEVMKSADKLGKAGKVAGSEISGLSNATIKAADSSEQASLSFAQFRTGALALATAAAGAAKAIFDVVDASSKMVDNTILLSRRVGLSVDTIIALDHAAGRGGSSLQALEFGLAAFTAKAGEAARNGGASAEVFEAIGISVTDSSGALRDMDVVLRETLDAIGSLETGTQRAAAASSLFGARGAEIVAVLGASSAPLDAAAAKTEDLAAAFHGAEEASAQMDAAMADLKTATDQATLAFGAGLTPDVTEVINLLAKAITKTAEFSDELITLGGVLVDITPGLDGFKTLTEALRALVGPMAEAEAAAESAAGTEGGGGIQAVRHEIEEVAVKAKKGAKAVDEFSKAVDALRSRFDGMMPKEELTRLDELKGLLDEATEAAIKAGKTTPELEKLIITLGTEIDEERWTQLGQNVRDVAESFGQADAEAAGLIETTDDLDDEPPMTGWEKAVARVVEKVKDLKEQYPLLAKAVEKASPAFKGITSVITGWIGLIMKAVDLFDRFLQKTADVSLADFGDVASGEGDVSSTISGMVSGASAAIDEFVKRLPEVVSAFTAHLPTLLQSVAGNLDPILSALLDGLKRVIVAVSKNTGPIRKALENVLATLTAFVEKNLGQLVVKALKFGSDMALVVVDAVPALITAIVGGLPEIITELLRGIGDVVTAVIDAIPKIIEGLIAAIPEITLALTMAIPKLTAQLLISLTKLGPKMTIVMITTLVDAARAVWDSIKAADGLLPWIKSLLERIRPFVKEWISSLFTRDDRESLQNLEASFQDTPGPVRVGLEGLRARFAPGDTVVAAKDPAELMRQAAAAGGGMMGGGPTILDLRDGHLAFDRLFRRSINSGGALASLRSPNTGRVKVYG